MIDDNSFCGNIGFYYSFFQIHIFDVMIYINSFTFLGNIIVRAYCTHIYHLAVNVSLVLSKRCHMRRGHIESRNIMTEAKFMKN